jgi:hypothetical protein
MQWTGAARIIEQGAGQAGRAGSNAITGLARAACLSSNAAAPCTGQQIHKLGNGTINIAKRPSRAAGFEAVPRQWVVERTFA